MQKPEPTRLLYKYPGPFELQDGNYDYVIVPEKEVDSHLKLGWSMTPAQAKAQTSAKAEVKPIAKPAVKLTAKPAVKG